MLDVSCIIINYNSSEFTIGCVDSIIKNTNHLDYEIIITDNASNKEDFNTLNNYIISLAKNNIHLYRSVINTGFGGGNMHGIQYCKPTKYYAFINNDCEIESNILLDLTKQMDADENIGVCSPQMLNSNKEFVPTISAFPSVAKQILGRRFLETWFPKTNPKRKIQYSHPILVDFVIGSFMFIRSEDFNAVGGFDTNLFLYYEEADICYRIKNLGKNTCLFPSYTYIHHISKSTGNNKNPKIQIEHYISLLYFLKKNKGFIASCTVLNYLRIKYALKSIFKASKRPLFIAFIKGVPLTMSLKQEQKIIA